MTGGASQMPEVAFDHHSVEFRDRRLEIYRDLREQRCPVAHSTAHGGFYLAAGYDAVSEVARDDYRFSSIEGGLIPTNDVENLLPIQVDPPELERYRSLISPFLTPKAVKKHEPALQADIDNALGPIVERGGGELVSEFCSVIPTRATMRLLGLDPNDWMTFGVPLHKSASSVPGSREQRDALRKVHGFQTIIENEIDERIANPRDDLISALIDSEYEGVRTTRHEVVGLVRMLIFGGMDTVSAALSNILATLAERDDLRRFLTADLSRLPRAIEEFLRYEAPIQGFSRLITGDTSILDCPVMGGERVFVLWGSANHDEKEFSSPERLDLERFPNRHFAFGTGAHRCMGSTFARTELRMTLASFLTAIPDYYLDEGGVVESATIGQILGKRELHIRVGTPEQG